MLDDSSDIHSKSLPPDPLSEVLQDFRLSGISYGRCNLTQPWGIDFPAQSAARFHFIAHGGCWLRTPEGEWTELHAGDAVLLPRGGNHELAHAPQAPTRPLDELPLEEIGERVYQMRAGGDGAHTLLFCGSVTFEEPTIHPLLELMPSVLRVCQADVGDVSLRPLLQTMAAEASTERIGAATVLTRLADVLIARIIRAWAEAQCGDTTGWLAAIRDGKIGRALAAVHREPGHPWSVEALADIALTSRSLFAERFHAVVGMSPGRYLAQLRMQIASRWLRDGRLTIGQVAAKLGYESEASFSRAFKRFVGVAPSALRPATRRQAPASVQLSDANERDAAISRKASE